MSAIRVDAFGGPEVLQLRRVELPPPGPDDVLSIRYYFECRELYTFKPT